MFRKEILEEYRQKKHMTYQELGFLLGIKKNTLYAYIKGLRHPNLQKIKEISEIIHIDFFELIEISSKEHQIIEIIRKYSKLYEYILKNPEESIFEINKFIESRRKKMF